MSESQNQRMQSLISRITSNLVMQYSNSKQNVLTSTPDTKNTSKAQSPFKKSNQPSNHRIKKRPVTHTKSSSVSHPFAPTLNKYSLRIAHKRQSSHSTKKLKPWEQLYELHEKQGKRRQEIIKEQEDFQDEECTFSPNLHSKSSTQLKQGSSTPLVDRLYQWERARDQRLKIEREQVLEEDLTECTFSPTIHEFVDKSRSSILTKKGVLKFIERQLQARNQKLQTEEPRSPTPTKSRSKSPLQSSLKLSMNETDYQSALQKLHYELMTFKNAE